MHSLRRTLVLPFVVALGCGGDPPPDDNAGVDSQTSTATPPDGAQTSTTNPPPDPNEDLIPLDVEHESRDEAWAELQADSHVKMSSRSASCFTMIEATVRPLDEARDDADRLPTVLRFLASHGSALVDLEKPGISETVYLEIVSPGMLIKQGSTEYVEVILRQQVDGFGLKDSLVGGRFQDNELISVSGCLADPATAPPRVNVLALPNKATALAAMLDELGAENVTNPTIVEGRFHGRVGFVKWMYSRHEFDAITGEYLGERADEF